MKRKILSVLLCFVLAVASLFSASCTDGGKDNGKDDQRQEQETSEPKRTLKETVNVLQKNAFADSSLDDTCYGLSDEGVVGVNKNDYENQVLYAIPSDNEFEGEIINWNDYDFDGDNFHKFKSILDYAVAKNAQGVKVKLNMPKDGIIDFDTTDGDHGHFAIWQTGLNGFYLQGNGCTFNLQYEKLNWKGFIYFRFCKDVHIENVIVDYEVPNIIYGEIIEYDVSSLSIKIKVDKECNEFVKRAIDNDAKICSYLEFGRATKIPKLGGNYFVDSTYDNSGEVFEKYVVNGNETEGYTLTLTVSETQKSQFRSNSVGDLANIAFSYYVYNTVTFDGCERAYCENLTINYSPSMGIVSTGSKNIYFNRLKVAVKEGTNRLMTCCADAVHIYQQEGDVKITNSLIEYSHDDAVNLKSGYFYSFSDFNVKTHEITMTRDTNEMDAPKSGDIIEIYERETFKLKARLTVVSVTGNSLSYVVKVKESLVSLNMGDYDQCVVTNTACSDFLFKNNIVRNKRNRGVLCMARNAVIENNFFNNVAHGAVCLISFMDKFNEATVPSGTTVRNNKLINNNYELSPQGDILVSAMTSTGFPSVGVIKDVVIENNFITRNGAAGIALISTDNCTIKNNLLFNVCRMYKEDECAVYLRNSFNVTVEGNYSSSTSDSLLGILAKGVTDISSIKENNNYNLEISTGAFVKKTVSVAYTDKNIGIDGDISEWSDIGTNVEIEGASYEDETKISDLNSLDGFKVKMAKLAWKDDGIYFAFDVSDNELTFETISNFWFGDCVEIIATTFKEYPEEDLQPYKNRKDTIQAVFVPQWIATDGWNLHSDRTSNDIYANVSKIKGKCVYTESGYAGEMFIPFSLCTDFKEAVDKGESVVFNAVFADAQRNGRVRVQAGNVPHLVERYKKQTSRSVDYVFSK